LAGVPQPGAAIQGEVVQVEPLGAETIFACRVPDVERPVFARVGPDVPVKVGEKRQLGIDLSAAHVFDSDGNALRP
jgi:ABC-type sugar transport system ATPase subunit